MQGIKEIFTQKIQEFHWTIKLKYVICEQLEKQIQTQIQQSISQIKTKQTNKQTQTQIKTQQASIKTNTYKTQSTNMSLSNQQPDSFSQVNMNAIKNTKLFQKFMQNKSALLQPNTSALVNKTVEVKSSRNEKEQIEERVQGNVGHKWGVNRKNEQQEGNQKKMVVNVKKDHVHNSNIKKQLQNDINSQNSYPQQHYQPQSYEHPQEYQQSRPKISRSPRPNKQHDEESEEVQPYQNQRLKQQDLEYYESQNPKYIQEQQVDQQQLNEPTYLQPQRNPGQKRKRNFNPYANNNSMNQQNIKEALRNSPPSKQQQQSYNTNSLGIDPYIQHGINPYSQQTRPIQPSKAIYQQQKLTKLQSSPGRSNTTYPHSYNMPYNMLVQNNIPAQNNMPVQRQYQKPYSNNNSSDQLSQQQVNKNVSINSTSVQYSQSQYKQKYEQLQKKYEELKFQLKNQSKHRKKQFSQSQHQIQLLKQKVPFPHILKLFDVQSRQDTLLIQNQRLKDKCESQNLTKMKTQQQNKQLSFRINQLQDQLHMKDSTMKHKTDQTGYWKLQVDAMKQELNAVRLGLEKKIDEYNLLLGDYQIVRKERDNKDYLLEELRKNINALVEENSQAKDQIFNLVTKLYQMEQDNQVLRNDLKRQHQQMDSNTSQIHNYMKDLKEQHMTHNNSRERTQSSYIQRDRQQQGQHNMYEPHVNIMERSIGQREQSQRNHQIIGYRNDAPQINNKNSMTQQEKPINDKPTRRRGQFARERGQISKQQKFERDQRPLPVRQHPQHQRNIGQQRTYPINNHSQPPAINKPQNFISNNKNNNQFSRMQQISQELEKIKDMKAMNGAIRRKKIDLERQLQQLEEKMH